MSNKTIFAEEKEVSHADDITCPYCGFEYDDSWENHNESGDEECPDCGKKFHWSRGSRVWYDSAKDCKLNDEEHEFGGWGETRRSLYDSRYYKARHCQKCPEIELQDVPQ